MTRAAAAARGHRAAVLRYRLEWALLAAARGAFQRLSLESSIALGAAIGRAYATLRLPRTADAERNLALAFPDADASRRRALAIASFENLGRGLADVCQLQGPRRDELLARVDVEGIEHYEDARRRSASGGVIALTAHFGSWELCGVAMAELGHPVSVVHHPIANPWVEAMTRGWRTAAGVEEIEMGRAALGVFRALSKGRVVTLLLDQDAHRDEGVFAPFFGRAASTRSAPALLAMTRGVPVVPVFLFRRGTTTRHVVRLFPALDLDPPPAHLPNADSESAEALVRNVARMNAAIERAIRLAPDHWLWPHRRWKTRPPGEAPLYAPRRRIRRRGRGGARSASRVSPG